MDFRLLGPLEVDTADGAADVGTGKRAALLTYLLMHANEVVSAERLIDELWGEHPPATATKSVQVYVSQLRRALGANGHLLVTRGSGYVLNLEEGELDIQRFERLLAQARGALADGNAQRASRAASDALALWRGPALYDVAYESFAQNEAARLDELRLVARQTRIDADLALGKHAQLVGELESLVAEHPLHEGFRAQLMLALYRGGRQSEALEVYRQASRLLMDELGLEPGRELRELEGKVLSHAQELAPPAHAERDAAVVVTDASPPAATHRGARGARLVVLGGAVLAAAAGVTLIARGGSSGSGQAPRGDAVVLIDAASGRAKSTFTVGYAPASVTVGADAVWTVNADDQTISRVDARSRRVDTFGIGATPTDLVAGQGAVWVGASQSGPDPGALFQDELFEIDPARRTVRARVELPGASGRGVQAAPGQLAIGAGAVWALGGGETLARIDPGTGRVTGTRPGQRLQSIAVTRTSVWAIARDTTDVVEIDAHTLHLRRRVHLPATRLDGLAVGRGVVWAADALDGTLWRIESRGKLTTRTIDVGVGADAVTTGGGAVWVVNSLRGTVTKVDPRTNRAVKTIATRGTPADLAFGAGGLWVSNVGSAAAIRATHPAPGQKGLPRSSCEPIQSAGGRVPDRVIVSDFPFDETDTARTQPMANAIAFTLRRHHFRAGRFHLGYQSCNDATAGTGAWDANKCRANAKAYATTPAVLGVIGPMHSGCTSAELPILNPAPRGPVSVVSPTNDDVGLTRADPTLPRSALSDLYPTGTRNYVRLEASEKAEAAADAVLAHRLGVHRLYVLSDGSEYGERNAALFRAVTRAAGVPVVGHGRWDSGGRGYAALVARIQRAHADGVYFGGLSAPPVGQLIRSLRTRLGRAAALIAPIGFGPLDFLYDASHGAATGLYWSAAGSDAGLPTVGRSPAGRAFVHDFGATQPGVPVDPSSIYAAVSAEVLLDAVARSDGTRSSVARELLKTHLDETAIGPVGFDRYGDVRPAPVSILRVTRGAVSSVPYQTHSELYDVIVPPAALLR